tara:strand:+ start:19142 stop:19387 length:246 start_codon:yes stop_codon:yes gene_type:complete
MKGIVESIIDPIILLLFSAGVFLFMWGMLTFLWNADNPEKRKTGSDHMIWGIAGIFIMATVFGIVQLILSSFGLENPTKLR